MAAPFILGQPLRQAATVSVKFVLDLWYYIFLNMEAKMTVQELKQLCYSISRMFV
jgi:hypothetical protein